MYIGIDIVNVDRFNTWHTYARRSLLRVFTEQEIAYCLAQAKPEHFAVRFAAKEALYKALVSAGVIFPLLTVCRSAHIVHTHTGPRFILHGPLPDWSDRIRVTLSHERCCAIAFVLIE